MESKQGMAYSDTVDRKGFLVSAATVLMGAAVAGGLSGCSGEGTGAMGSSDEIKQHIDDLVAKDAIREKLYQYCRSVDRIDAELGYAVFAEDSELDYGPSFQGTGKEFIDWCLQSHRGLVATSHQLSNITIHVDGEKAGSEAYGRAFMNIANDDGTFRLMDMGIRYNDLWERRDGSWVIVKRVVAGDISFSVPYETDMGSYNSKRDKSDPSYNVLNP